MTVTLIEITLTVLSVTAAGIIAGYLLSRKIINRDAVSPDDLKAVEMKYSYLQASLEAGNEHARRIEKELADERAKCNELSANLASREQEIKTLKESIDSGKREFDKLNLRFNEEFRKMANQILLDNSGEFNRQTAEKLKDILSPFKEHIEKFEKKIDDSQLKQIEESTSLKAQINQLGTLNIALSDEARNLTNALKNESKTRGRWGEVILEKILESSGLIKDEHYTLQTSLKGEENSRLQPDVIIHLPENKHIIIDSKVILVDYERYCSANDDAEREACLKSHINAIYGQVDNLRSKEYQKALGVNPPDFVLMFVPIEAALVVALERDRDLFGYAWKNNIAIISATTLIPTLKIIHNIWRQESQNKNAVAIAETGGKLYEKIVGFLEDLLQVGKGIENARNRYEEAVKKLSTGRGNALSLAERMKEMGAKTEKQIPDEMARDAEI